ncbi:MAG TPA: PRC-barrel domain-containing protein [Patescibacteria group bacterium]
MEKNLLALFDTESQADSAVIELSRRGYRTENMSVIASNSTRSNWVDSDTPEDRVTEGVASGAALGGLAGLLAGAGVVPALAGILIGGPFAAALGLTGLAAATVSGAITGGMAGGLVGALSNFGLSEADANEFSEGVNRGGVVVALPVTEKTQDEVTQVLQDAGARKVNLAVANSNESSANSSISDSHGDNPFTAEQVNKQESFKAKDIIGKTIMSYSDGKAVYKVYDIIHDAFNQKVLGFLVDESWILARGRHLPLSAIRSIGKDAVTVDTGDTVLMAKDDPQVKRILDSGSDIRGHKIVTEDGEEVGKVTDFYFQGDTGVIDGYEVSRGLSSDTYKGKAYLPAAEVAKIGEELIFVRRDIGDMLNEQQTGGVQGAVDKAKGKTQETIGAAREKVAQGHYSPEFMQATVAPAAETVKEKTMSAWEKIKEQISDMKEQSSQALEAKRIKAALGRPVTRVILDSEDNVILNTGDLITHESVNRAREHNILDALLDSVYKDKPEFTNNELRADDQDEV